MYVSCLYDEWYFLGGEWIMAWAWYHHQALSSCEATYLDESGVGPTRPTHIIMPTYLA